MADNGVVHPKEMDPSDLWRMFFTLGPGLIVVLNADVNATVWDANPALCKASGFSRADMVDQPWRNFVSSVGNKQMARAIQELIADKHGIRHIRGIQRWERASAIMPPIAVDVVGFRLPPMGPDAASFIVLVGAELKQEPLVRRDSVVGKLLDAIIVDPKPWATAIGYVITAVVAVLSPSIFKMFVAAVKGEAPEP